MDAPGPARRIVSLVPSLTEALFVLGLGERVVGVTDWCVHPAEALAGVPRLGGTKDPDVARVAALRPDLVIANREENTRRAVDALRAAGLRVWVTYPRGVGEALVLLREIAALGASEAAVAEHLAPAEAAFRDALAQRQSSRPRVFCPIWKDPWMAVGSDTYADDLIRVCGGANVFADAAERRYPRVREAEIAAAQPEVVLLPDEPYAFGPAAVAELGALPLPAARTGRIHLIDGTLVSWYGPRIERAIRTIRVLIGAACQLDRR